MQTDPMQTWRQLTAHYAQMSEGELINLAEDLPDLTDMARQVLRDEMRKRGLGDPQNYAANQSNPASAQTKTGSGSRLAASSSAPGSSLVWKTLLCECSNREEAWQISEVLRRAAIENWIDGAQVFYTPLPEMDMSDHRLRVLVASDTLDAARAVLASPIPQDIIEQSKAEQAEYEPPVCPSCGAPDPLLEDVDPANSWKCEVCGRQWTEAVGQTGNLTQPD
jgi:hypothetical protein